MKKLLIIGFASLCGTMAALADTWSYADCVQYALNHNIDLEKSRLNELSAGYDLEAAEAQWEPTLDFSTSHTYTAAPLTSNGKNAYNGQLGLNAAWTLYDGGIRSNNIKSAKLRSSIEGLATENISRSLRTDLLQIYLNILYAKENIEIYKEAVNLSQQQTDRAEQLMKAGKLSKVDYSQLKAQLEQDNYSLVNAEGTYNTRRLELKKLLELGIDADITPASVEWTESEVLASLPEMSSSYELAVKNDPQLQSLDLENEVAQLDVKTAQAGRSPKVGVSAGVGTGYNSLGAGFGTQMKQQLSGQVGLNLSIPILDNKSTKVAVAKAKLESLTNDLEKESRQIALAQEVENWYIDVRNSQARYLAAQEQEKAATVSNDYVNEQFRLGLAVTVELVNAHNNLLEARHSMLQAKYMTMLGKKMIEYYRTTNIEL